MSRRPADLPERLVRWASLGALAGLAMLAWALIGPPLALLLFMSIGQVVGITSLVLYVVAVLVDLRRARVLVPGPIQEAPPS